MRKPSQQHQLTRTARVLGALGIFAVGGIGWWVLWMEGHPGVGFILFMWITAKALYLGFASDEKLRNLPWWISW